VSAPLEIVHSESSLGWGGQEIRILSESQGFIRRGHRVTLVCPPEARIYAEAPRWGVPALALPIARKRPAGVRALIELFKLKRYDVVSAHSSTDAWLAALALLVMGRPFPMVRTRHISAPVSRSPLSRSLYTRASARVVTTGESLKAELVARNGFPADKLVSVPTGIDGTRFAPGDRDAARAALGLPVDRMLIGIVATLRSWKGHRFLIEAVAAMQPGVSLVIVGDGPQREALAGLVATPALRGRVWMPGNQDDVLPWLRALDVFALPSYANEGVPQALMQAMLVGLACVTTHAGSIAELARHEETALVVPPQDVERLRSALERLAGDAALRARLGAAARQHCLERYSLEAMLDRMEAIYRQASGRT
jgi:glycosyltransferase involved in cell wall biosynthesis